MLNFFIALKLLGEKYFALLMAFPSNTYGIKPSSKLSLIEWECKCDKNEISVKGDGNSGLWLGPGHKFF